MYGICCNNTSFIKFFNSFWYQRLLLFQIKKGVGFKHSVYYGCIKGNGFKLSTNFPMDINSNKPCQLGSDFPRPPASILSGAYFNIAAILLETSASLALLWLTTTLAWTNKRKWSIKKWRNQAKLNATEEDFYFNKFVKFPICLYLRLPSSESTIFS